MSARTFSRKLLVIRRDADRRLNAEIERALAELSQYMTPDELTALLHRIAGEAQIDLFASTPDCNP